MENRTLGFDMKRDISRARTKQVLHARFLHNLASSFLLGLAMRREVLHESHQGSVWTKQRARLVVYWPGIDNDIEIVIITYHLEAVAS